MIRAVACLILVASLLGAPLVSQPPRVNDVLWERANTLILGKLTNVDPNIFDHRVVQLTAFPVYADWHELKGVFSLYMLADSVPLDSPLWLWEPNRRFSTNYERFLSAIDLDSIGDVTPARRQERQQLSSMVQVLGKRCATLLERAVADWNRFDAGQAKNSLKIDFDTWWSNRNHALLQCRTQLFEAYNDYYDLLDPRAVVIAQARKAMEDALSNPNTRVEMPLTAQDALSSVGGTRTVFRYQRRPPFLAPDLTAFLDGGRAQFKTGQPEDTWRLTKTTSRFQYTQEGYSGSASYGGFIQLGGGTSNSETITHSDDMEIEFSYYKLQMIPVAPSDWYDEQVLADFACGPFKASSKMTPTGLWGRNGSLARVPSEILLAYKPQLTFRMNVADFREVWEHASGSAGFSIGPFSIGGGGGRVEHSIERSEDGQTMTVRIQSDAAMVLAVLSRKLNVGRTDESCRPASTDGQ